MGSASKEKIILTESYHIITVDLERERRVPRPCPGGREEQRGGVEPEVGLLLEGPMAGGASGRQDRLHVPRVIHLRGRGEEGAVRAFDVARRALHRNPRGQDAVLTLLVERPGNRRVATRLGVLGEQRATAVQDARTGGRREDEPGRELPRGAPPAAGAVNAPAAPELLPSQNPNRNPAVLATTTGPAWML